MNGGEKANVAFIWITLGINVANKKKARPLGRAQGGALVGSNSSNNASCYHAAENPEAGVE